MINYNNDNTVILNDKLYLFKLLLITSLTFTCYFLYNSDYFMEKVILLISIFLQLIAIILVFLNISNILEIIDKLYILVLIFGIKFFQNYYLNIFSVILLCVTLLTRIIFNECLFYINNVNPVKSDIIDILFSIIIISYIIKLFFI